MPTDAKFWTIPREFPGEVFFILAGGSSLRSPKSISCAIRNMEQAGRGYGKRYEGLVKVREQLLSDPTSLFALNPFDPEALQGKGRVIVINDSYLLCPWAEALYFCDGTWWKGVRDFAIPIFKGKYRISMGTSEDGTKRVGHGGIRGLSKAPESLAHGTNSGYQAINLAFHLGASHIILLGYDMHCTGAAHWHTGHGPYDADPKRYEAKIQHDMLPRFQSLVDPLRSMGVQVTNCSPGSALRCWPMGDLEKVLEGLGTGAVTPMSTPTPMPAPDDPYAILGLT